MILIKGNKRAFVELLESKKQAMTHQTKQLWKEGYTHAHKNARAHKNPHTQKRKTL
jgi:hypothetical protein